MPRQAIKQATCTECDESDDNYRLTDKELVIEEDTINYEVACACGEEATITIDGDGTSATENVSYEDASWNQDDEEADDE